MVTNLKRTVCALRCRPLSASFAAVVPACVFSILFVDRPLALYYRHAADPQTVAAFHFVTELGDATGYVIALLLVLVGCILVRMRSLYISTFARLARVGHACVFILLSLAVSGAVLHLIKFTLGRFRPRALFESGVYDLSVFTAGYLNSSFPSGHSQVAGALAAALIIVYPRYDALYVLVAGLIGYSRIVTGDHYPSDVLFGLFLGAATAVLIKRRVYDRRGISLRIVLPRDRALAKEAAQSPPPSAREHGSRAGASA